MGIKTEDMVNSLPPKEMTPGVDWLGILDSFDPKTLDERFLNECARRNPYDTCYKWDTPSMPIEERLHSTAFGISSDRRNLEYYVKRIEDEGLNASLYKNARMCLIKTIGSIGAHEYNQREYEKLGEEGRKKQEEKYRQFEKEWKEQRLVSEEEYDPYAYEYNAASVHEKVIRLRKGFKDSEGKPLTQRDFAKFLEYPVNKYAEAEKVDRRGRNNGEEESTVEDLLLERLIFRCHANPYWLFDEECEADYGHEDRNALSVREGDEPCIYAPPDVILQWIREGKKHDVAWNDRLF